MLGIAAFITRIGNIGTDDGGGLTLSLTNMREGKATPHQWAETCFTPTGKKRYPPCFLWDGIDHVNAADRSTHEANAIAANVQRYRELATYRCSNLCAALEDTDTIHVSSKDMEKQALLDTIKNLFAE